MRFKQGSGVPKPKECFIVVQGSGPHPRRTTLFKRPYRRRCLKLGVDDTSHYTAIHNNVIQYVIDVSSRCRA